MNRRKEQIQLAVEKFISLVRDFEGIIEKISRKDMPAQCLSCDFCGVLCQRLWENQIFETV